MYANAKPLEMATIKNPLLTVCAKLSTSNTTQLIIETAVSVENNFFIRSTDTKFLH